MSDRAKVPPVNDACAVSACITICSVLSCSVREPVKREMDKRDLQCQCLPFQHLWPLPIRFVQLYLLPCSTVC